jgi:addiction module HigA family antidote
MAAAPASTASASTGNGASASSGRQEVPTVSKSSTTTKQISSPTPGEVSLLDFIQPMGLTQNGLARAVGVPPRRINEIVLGKRSITADTDLRLARFFGVSDGFWLGLQTAHDLLQQRREIDADLAPYRRAAGMENVWSPRGLTSPATRITRTRSPRQT